MKWMGGWSWDDLYICPPEIYDEIVLLINEEAERLENP